MAKEAPLVSLNVVTDKYGGLDILATGLIQQTYDDFEIIIIDELYSKRRNKVIPFLKSLGVTQCIKHVPIRYTHNYPCNLASAHNTGIIHSRGDIILTLGDYIVIPPEYIEKHLFYQMKYKYKALICGIKAQAKAPLHYTDGFTLNNKKGLLRSWNEDFVFNPDNYILYGHEPAIFEFYEVNPRDLLGNIPILGHDVMSYPIQAWLDVNGFYEELDQYFEKEDWECYLRMLLAGYRAYVVPDLVAYHIPHKQRDTPGRGYFGPEIPTRMLKIYNKEIDIKAPNSFSLEKLRRETLGL